jgi:GcrA cell cycle regulator
VSNWHPSDEQLEDLKRGWTIEGLSAGQLAQTFGQTRNVIIGHIHRKGWAKAGGSGITRRTAPAKAPLAVKKPLPAPPPKKIELVLEPKGFVEIDQLGPHHCRYPVDTRDGEHKGKYCGKVPNGSPYCEGHARLVYQPQQPRKITKGKR